MQLVSLVNALSRETILKRYIEMVKDSYDFILIDCMPSLGMITINALVAAVSVLIPVQAHYLPTKGMTQLIQTDSPGSAHQRESAHFRGAHDDDG